MDGQKTSRREEIISNQPTAMEVDMRSIIMQGMGLVPAPSREEDSWSLHQYIPPSLFLSEVGESALQETTHNDGGGA